VQLKIPTQWKIFFRSGEIYIWMGRIFVFRTAENPLKFKSFMPLTISVWVRKEKNNKHIRRLLGFPLFIIFFYLFSHFLRSLSLFQITLSLSLSPLAWSPYVLSDWTSVYGWKVVLNLNLVPIASCRLFQNLDVKRRSRFETMVVSTPCNLTTSWTYNSANFSTSTLPWWA
jgi:hypothetical protein